jgi:hypothetical protein
VGRPPRPVMEIALLYFFSMLAGDLCEMIILIFMLK